MKTPVVTQMALEKPDERGWLYVISCDRFHKVGVTNSPHRRMAQMMLHNPMDMDLVLYRRVPRPVLFYVETQAHALLSEHHHRGEWFAADLKTIRIAVDKAMYLGRRKLKTVEQRLVHLQTNFSVENRRKRGFFGELDVLDNQVIENA